MWRWETLLLFYIYTITIILTGGTWGSWFDVSNIQKAYKQWGEYCVYVLYGCKYWQQLACHNSNHLNGLLLILRAGDLNVEIYILLWRWFFKMRAAWIFSKYASKCSRDKNHGKKRKIARNEEIKNWTVINNNTKTLCELELLCVKKKNYLFAIVLFNKKMRRFLPLFVHFYKLRH